MTAQHNPYGEDHGAESAALVLMQLQPAAASSWAPSAPPVASHDQALRTTFDPMERDDAADNDTPKADAAEPANGLMTLAKVERRFKHIVDATLDQSNLDHHNQTKNQPVDDN